MPLVPHLLHAHGLRRRWRWLLLLMLAITSWLAFMPAQPQPDAAPHLDKLEHVVAFAALSFVARLGGDSRSPALRVGLALLAYGLLIEVVQSWLPSRHADVLDLAADAAGIVLGLLLLSHLRRRWPYPAPGP
ncbi:MAG: VanZ family protein [Rubrivivax sp.]|nr:VanZ family protein [Rubrivivax sp.]